MAAARTRPHLRAAQGKAGGGCRAARRRRTRPAARLPPIRLGRGFWRFSPRRARRGGARRAPILRAAFALGAARGRFHVTHDPARRALIAAIAIDRVDHLDRLVARLRARCSISTPIRRESAQRSRATILIAPRLATGAGPAAPRATSDPFEAGPLRAVIGQRISGQGAATLLGRLAALHRNGCAGHPRPKPCWRRSRRSRPHWGADRFARAPPGRMPGPAPRQGASTLRFQPGRSQASSSACRVRAVDRLPIAARARRHRRLPGGRSLHFAPGGGWRSGRWRRAPSPGGPGAPMPRRPVAGAAKPFPSAAPAA